MPSKSLRLDLQPGEIIEYSMGLKLGVWSRHLLDRVEDEATWLFCPGVADVLIGREPFQDLEAASEVVGRDEVGQVRSELLVTVVVIAIDRRFLEGTVHALDLTIRPRVVGFGQAVFDTVGSADLVEAVDPVTSRPPIAIFWQVGKLDTVIGQHRMQSVRYGRD